MKTQESFCHLSISAAAGGGSSPSSGVPGAQAGLPVVNMEGTKSS